MSGCHDMARSRAKAAKEKSAGLTLIETMIAVAILAGIGAVVWGGMVQTTRNKATLEERAAHAHVVRATLERMARELGAAYVSVHLNPDPSLQAMQTAFVGRDRGDRDRIDFTSFSHQRLYRDAHQSDQNELSYFVTDHPDGEGRVLARREQHRVDEKPQEGGQVEVMVEGVEGLELEYFDPQTGQWLSSWDTTQAAMQPNRLPAQVKIKLTVQDPRDPDRTRVFATRATPQLRFAVNHAAYNP